MKTSDSIPDYYVDETALQEAKEFILSRWQQTSKLAIILGSGLGPFADSIQQDAVIPTKEIPHYPISTVAGHAGRWIFGQVAGKKILALAGRVHTYEGYPISRVAFMVHLLAEIGVTRLIVTNASGGVNQQFAPGDLMLIDDHINLLFANPLRGQHDKKWGERWPDMAQPYDRELQETAMRVARDLKISLRRGVIVCSKGPSYESAAEVRMYQRLGGDAATMSTVPEVITAVSRGMKVLGISCVTNMCTGLSDKKLDHAEVTETANRISERFATLVKGIVKEIG